MEEKSGKNSKEPILQAGEIVVLEKGKISKPGTTQVTFCRQEPPIRL